MTLFRVHHNNRVQFDLGPPVGGDSKNGDGTASSSSSSSKQQQSNNNNSTERSKFNIKKFVTSSIFTNNSSSTTTNNNNNNNSSSSTKPLLSKNKDGSFNSSYIDSSYIHDDDDDPETALIKKMLVPSPPKRLGSFLKVGNSSSAAGGSGRGGGSNNNGTTNSPTKGDLDRLEEKFLMSSSGQLPPPLPSSSSSSSSSPKFTYSSLKNTQNLTSSSQQQPPSTSPTKQSKERIAKLLKKAQHSHKKLFRYRLAMRYYLLALKEMNTSGYHDTHPLITKVLKSLNDVHHAQTTLSNSANIVKMGIHHEDSDQLVKALKMYTVAYRMRRDALGVDHPSLPVLLNMMGSVQVKRGEYTEAMQILHLSLKGRPDENGGRGRNKEEFRKNNPLTTSVTLRDMGMILEHKGNEEQALRFYHSSLRYAVKFRSETRENNNANSTTRGSNGGLDDNGSANGSNMSIGSGSERDGPTAETATAAASSSREDEFDFLDQLVYSTENGDDDNNNNNGDATTTNKNSLNHHHQELELFDYEPFSLDEVRMAKTTTIMEKAESYYATDDINGTGGSGSGGGGISPMSEDECGEMELFFEKRFDKLAIMRDDHPAPSPSNDGSMKKFYYDELFVKSSSSSSSSPKIGKKVFEATPAAAAAAVANGHNYKWEGADVDIAMTLHQIGQIHRRSLRYAAALSAYNASLRGMKEVLGSRHANIAAILGNIGNLYMETGDYDEAFKIYQEVLGIETLHLGLSHPEVAVTLHNIATIECSRGNFAEGVSLYRQVVDMQKIRFGPQHITVAVTLSCLADANEKLGNVDGAIRTYEEALQIRMKVLGKSHIDVGRILHKLGRLASSRNDYRLANVYIMKAAEIYADNKLKQDHPFLREMARDMADIQAGLAFSGCKGVVL
jgi:tetratricopeptide (TPR) repeat protein